MKCSEANQGFCYPQGEEMWLLQRICEKDRPFHPLPSDFKDFKRGFSFTYFISGIVKNAFAAGKLVGGLGADFALYKEPHGGYSTTPLERCGHYDRPSVQLVAICRFVEDAKANIKQDLEHMPDLHAISP